MTTTLEHLVTTAPDSVVEDGMQWYDGAHDHAVQLGKDLKVPTRNAAGCLAALSPQLDAALNFSDLVLQILEGRSVAPVTGRQRDKARRCLREDPATVLNWRTGPKTWAFWWNIYHPSLRGQVTIDGRTADIIDNTLRPWDAHRGLDVGGRGTKYERYEFAVEDCARRLRITAPQVQAIAWTEAKRIELSYPHCRGLKRKQGPPRRGQPYIEETT